MPDRDVKCVDPAGVSLPSGRRLIAGEVAKVDIEASEVAAGIARGALVIAGGPRPRRRQANSDTQED